jgi:hypothetical protein
MYLSFPFVEKDISISPNCKSSMCLVCNKKSLVSSKYFTTNKNTTKWNKHEVISFSPHYDGPVIFKK